MSFDVETEAMHAAQEIQSAYEEQIEGDSETIAFLMAPILAALNRCREATEEECIKLICKYCERDLPVSRTPVMKSGMTWWRHETEAWGTWCPASDIHERRRRRREKE